MRALVTGGAGFIGSHLVDRLLNEGWYVTVLDSLISGKLENVNKNATFVCGDILDFKLLESLLKDVSVVFHLAAIPSVQQSTERWIDCHKVNLGGSINVFEAASNQNVPVIYASSAAVYGNSMSLPLKESTVVLPSSPYGFDKYSCEVQAQLFAKFKNLQSIGLRFFNVYGPRQDPASPYSGVISIFADSIKNNRQIKIFGDGRQERDFIFVQDVVDVLVKAYSSFAKLQSSPEIFNVCTKIGTSITELVDIMFSTTNRTVSVSYVQARDGDIYKSSGNNEKIHNLLGFKPYTSLKDGLKSFLSQI